MKPDPGTNKRPTNQPHDREHGAANHVTEHPNGETATSSPAHRNKANGHGHQTRSARIRIRKRNSSTHRHSELNAR